MKRSFNYFRTYKYLGPLQIIIQDLDATVISILGIKTFKFNRLQRNSKYAILKLAIRSYFKPFLEKQENKKEENGFSDIFGFLIGFTTKLALESNDQVEKIKMRMLKNVDEFDWENIDDFMEVDSNFNVLQQFPIPILVQFDHFKEDLIFEKLKIKHKAVENKSKILVDFIKAEINFPTEIYFNQNSSYNTDQIFTDNRGIHENIAFDLSNLNSSYNINQVFNDIRSIHEKIAFDLSKLNLDYILLEDISNIYLENFELFFSYKNFIKAYENIKSNSLNENYNLILKMTKILTKLTNYTKVFQNLTEIDDSEKSQELILKFYDLNKHLNDYSERLHLDFLKIKLLKTHEKTFKNHEILCAVECGDYSLALFDNFVAIFKDQTNLKLIIENCKLEILICAKFIYFIVNEKISHRLPFVNISDEFSTCLVFDWYDREIIQNFSDKFYQQKFNIKEIKKYKNYYYILENIDWIGNKVVVSNLSNESNNDFYTVRIEDQSFRVGGIEKLSKKELILRIDQNVEQKRMEILNRRKNLKIITAVISQQNMKPLSFESYPEDEVNFNIKNKAFNNICDFILNYKDEEPDFNNDFIDLSVEDILNQLEITVISNKNDQTDIINEYNKMYYAFLYSGNLQSTSLKSNIIILAMFLRRNLYYFFDIENIELLDESSIIWDKSVNEKLKNVLKYLMNKNKIIYKELIIKSIFYTK